MNRLILLLTAIAILTSCSDKIEREPAQQFIETLEANSAFYHTIPLNKYYLIDLDRDGDLEIIERKNRFEFEHVGFLNVQISSAFNYDEIYILKDGKYALSDKDVGRHLELQLPHFKLWKELIQNPVNLNADSKMLIEANKKDFLNEIDYILEEYNKRIE